VPDQDRYVIGDTELVNLIEVDAASAERPGEGPAVAVDNALSATHAHSHDVDELGIVGEQLAELVGVLRIQGPREGVDQSWVGPGVVYFARLTELASKSRLSQIASSPIYPRITVRNWNTTTKLAALLDQR